MRRTDLGVSAEGGPRVGRDPLVAGGGPAARAERGEGGPGSLGEEALAGLGAEGGGEGRDAVSTRTDSVGAGREPKEGPVEGGARGRGRGAQAETHVGRDRPVVLLRADG